MSDKEDDKFAATAAHIALCIAFLLGLTFFGSCWVENHYSVKRIEAATKGGVQFKVYDGLHREDTRIVEPSPSPTK